MKSSFLGVWPTTGSITDYLFERDKGNKKNHKRIMKHVVSIGISLEILLCERYSALYNFCFPSWLYTGSYVRLHI